MLLLTNAKDPLTSIQYYEQLAMCFHAVDFASSHSALNIPNRLPSTIPLWAISYVEKIFFMFNLVSKVSLNNHFSHPIFVPSRHPPAHSSSYWHHPFLKCILFWQSFKIHRLLPLPNWADLKQCANLCRNVCQVLNLYFATAGAI